MLRVIGNDQNLPRQEQAVASGTLPSGKPVVVNADGTVSVVAETAVSQIIGSEVKFSDGPTTDNATTYDTTNDKGVIFYKRSSRGKCRVVTISSNGASYGTEVEFHAADLSAMTACFDSNSGKIAVFYRDAADSDKGKYAVGTISGTDISFGSEGTFENAAVSAISAVYDPTNNRIIVGYQDEGNSNYGTGIVGTLSGTTISFGTAVVFLSSNTGPNSLVFDPTSGKTVFVCRDNGDSNKGKAFVATVDTSDNSIAYGSVATFEAGAAEEVRAIMDISANRVVVAYRDSDDSHKGTACVGTISGTSISFGNVVVFDTGRSEQIGIVYHAGAEKTVILYSDGEDDGPATSAVGTVSGTTISFATAVVIHSGGVRETDGSLYDPDNKRILVTYKDIDDSQDAKTITYTPAFTDKNITSENYIGISSGVAFQTGSAAAAGTAVQYEAGDSVYNAIAYDTNVDRVVIVYQDSGNSDYGTAIVGTVDGSDNSISFGTAVVFESAASTRQSIAYEANAQKVVIAYTDGGNSGRGTAIVGTVDSSDNSISFGSPTVFNAAATIPYSTTFDASTNKVVVGFRDSDTKGYAIVGTVSGTDITFGSEAKFNDANTIQIMSAYDTNAEKIVFAYVNGGSSSAGTSIVGTVSGTDITFGSAAVFETGTTSHPNIGYDSDSQKVVIAYKDEGDSNKGKAVVGTVSGTSISFGTIVVFNAANTEYTNVVYDTDTDKIVITYEDIGNSQYATAIDGTVSGTDISFGSETVLRAATSSYLGSVYDPDQKRVVTAIRDEGSSSGKAIVFKTNSIAVTRGEVTNGNHALIDTRGALSDNQIGLTPGQSYFVQNDGTIGTSADDPSVFAGTAVAATKLIVKG